MIRANNAMKYLDTKILPSLIDKELRKFSLYYNRKRICILLDSDTENYILGNSFWQHFVEYGPNYKTISTTATYYEGLPYDTIRECSYYDDGTTSGSYVRFIKDSDYYKDTYETFITKDADLIIANPNKKRFKEVLLEILDYKKFLVLGEINYINIGYIPTLIHDGKLTVKNADFENLIETPSGIEKPQLCWYTNLFDQSI